VDEFVLRRLEEELRFRADNRMLIAQMVATEPGLAFHRAIAEWRRQSEPLVEPRPRTGQRLSVYARAANPAWFGELVEIGRRVGVRVPNLYGYDRAYTHQPVGWSTPRVVLDPTAGGGSIAFEAMRLGHRIVANELNPVASVILHATLEYPLRFGCELAADIRRWGQRLLERLDGALGDLFARTGAIPPGEIEQLRKRTGGHPQLARALGTEEVMSFLYCRQVTCPYCGGKAPLLNTCWLSKEGEQWGVQIIPDTRTKDVRFDTYRVSHGRGPDGQDPDFATVADGTGTCIHCRQAIPEDEIKRQARGESRHGRWTDRLYCVVAVRHQPKLDAHGQPQRYASGKSKGEIKTEKVTFFRPPNAADLAALDAAAARLEAKWDEWDSQGLIPTEQVPPGQKTREPQNYGMPRWCDMFTPRQLLGHVTMLEELIRLQGEMRQSMPEDRMRAVATYLQFVIDKGVDYNSKQTRWHYSRAVLINSFGRHDYSLKWTFGEMIFTGPNSGAAWALAQVVDAYAGIAALAGGAGGRTAATVISGPAAHLATVETGTVDLVCMDPPYYDNVQYAELSDFFYVWMRRSLHALYPDLFVRRLTNKLDEAVANPARDGSARQAKLEYERRMGEIFAEAGRVLKPRGIMTVMFTHKSQDAWEALTRALIETGWVISACYPVDSEAVQGIHIKDTASAASSIFIACRKRAERRAQPAVWLGFGGTGVQQQVVAAVSQALPEFERLHLNPVDEMVASYGRALRVLSEQWPVLDGDEPVSPLRAMNEASRVVAAHQITRLTSGRLRVSDLEPEAAMTLTLFGLHGLDELPYDEALNLSRSLSIRLETRQAGYTAEGPMLGINQQERPSRRTSSRSAESVGYHAPVVRSGSKLRVVEPAERHPRRCEVPQTEWDALCGLIMAYRRGDIPVARAYLQQQERFGPRLLDLLAVWTAQVGDETLRKEGEAMLFGLRGAGQP